MNRFKLFFAFGVVVCLALATTGCGSPEDKAAEKAAKLEAEIIKVFEEFQAAQQKHDYKALFETASRESIKQMIFQAIVSMGSGASSKESELILTKYVDQNKLAQLGSTLNNPTKEQVMELYLVCISDPKGMFIDSYNYLHQFDPQRKGPTFTELTDIKVTGDVASAKTTMTNVTVTYQAKKGDDKPERMESTYTGEVTVYFVRDGGKWVCATENEWAGIIGH